MFIPQEGKLYENEIIFSPFMEVCANLSPKEVETVINILQKVILYLVYFVSLSDPLAFARSSKQMGISHEPD